MSTHIDRISCLYLPIEFLKYKSNWATDRTRPNQVVNRAYVKAYRRYVYEIGQSGFPDKQGTTK